MSEMEWVVVEWVVSHRALCVVGGEWRAVQHLACLSSCAFSKRSSRSTCMRSSNSSGLSDAGVVLELCDRCLVCVCTCVCVCVCVCVCECVYV